MVKLPPWDTPAWCLRPLYAVVNCVRRALLGRGSVHLSR
jgi:hypothetical protein